MEIGCTLAKQNPIHEQQQPQAQKFTIENGDP